MTEKKKKKYEIILEFIKQNPHLTAKQIAIELKEYNTYIAKIAKDAHIELPKEPKGRKLGWRKPEDEKKTKVRIPIEEKKKEEQEQVEEDTTLKAAEEILRKKEERRKEIEANRPKGVYNQSTSPYGLTEQFGISAKTKK